MHVSVEFVVRMLQLWFVNKPNCKAWRYCACMYLMTLCLSIFASWWIDHYRPQLLQSDVAAHLTMCGIDSIQQLSILLECFCTQACPSARYLKWLLWFQRLYLFLTKILSTLLNKESCKWQIVRIYYKQSLKQLYAYTAKSTNFINPQALSCALASLIHYNLRLLGL